MRDLDLYRWKDRFIRDGLTVTARLELRELLAPKIAVRRHLPWPGELSKAKDQKGTEPSIDCELVLTADHVYSVLGELESTQWRQSLPALLGDLQQLLRDGLDLLRELDEADDRTDPSYWHFPSISSHPQNRGHHDWVVLIELVRDAWLTIRHDNPDRARGVAVDWYSEPYLTFKRLALFAASQDGCVSGEQWVGWLLADDSWWLWSATTLRETMRLLVLQGRHLTTRPQGRLEAAILVGPPRSMYRDDLTSERWNDLADRSIWRYLAKLQSSGSQLGLAAAERFAELSTLHAEWRLADDERDEFSFWMGGAEFFEGEFPVTAPRREATLHDRWQKALQNWSKEGRERRSWRLGARVAANLPDELLEKVAHSITWWLKEVAKSLDSHETLFLQLCERILALPNKDERDEGEPINRAINHPVGHITQALIDLWFNRKPNDNDGLPTDLKPLFTQLSDPRLEHFRHGRVLLASRLIAFFRVDRPWTDSNLLPLFEWEASFKEAHAAWAGFLWSPRLFRPLLMAFRKQFLDTARHYEDLGELGRQFAAFLTFAALDPVETYSEEDFRNAFRALPKEGLQQSAETLVNALKGASEQREDYWDNHILPFWERVWPKSQALASPRIADSLAQLSIEARGRFPAALDAVSAWLHPIEHPGHVIRLLHESRLPRQFPLETLRLLDAVIADQPWAPPELGQCLTAISEAAPALEQDLRFERLRDYFRRRRM